MIRTEFLKHSREMSTLLLFVVILAANAPCAIGDCDGLSEFDAYMRDFIEKFVSDKKPNLDCLEYIIREKPQCPLKNFALAVKTPDCDKIRTSMTQDDNISFSLIHAKTANWGNILAAIDVDIDDVCEVLQKFNKKPKSSRTKKDYATVYDSVVKDFGLAWIIHVAAHHYGNPSIDKYPYHLERCYHDIFSAIAKFFQVPAPKPFRCLMNSKLCKPKK